MSNSDFIHALKLSSDFQIAVVIILAVVSFFFSGSEALEPDIVCSFY